MTTPTTSPTATAPTLAAQFVSGIVTVSAVPFGEDGGRKFASIGYSETVTALQAYRDFRKLVPGNFDLRTVEVIEEA